MEEKLDRDIPPFATKSPEILLKLEFSGLTYYVKKKKESVCVMHGASGACLPGTLTAIMGPSGAGKSTLLNILSGRIRQSKVQGNIYLNGRPRTKLSRLLTAYVMQSDIFFPHLTVYDTLRYTALLRLGKISHAEKIQRVEDVIQMMGLSGCRNSKIGDAYRRGISGGEMKRVNAANELLTNPSLFMLDEPTSGLDSNAAAMLVDSLYSMAHDTQRTVVCSIHQPSSQVFHRFDRLIGVMGGYLVYQGDVKKCGEYFGGLGFDCPNGYNLADHIIEFFTNQSLLNFLIQAYRKYLVVDSRGVYDMEIPTLSKNIESPLIINNEDTCALQVGEDSTGKDMFIDRHKTNTNEKLSCVHAIDSAEKNKEKINDDRLKKGVSYAEKSEHVRNANSFEPCITEVHVHRRTSGSAGASSAHEAEKLADMHRGQGGLSKSMTNLHFVQKSEDANLTLDQLIKKYHERPSYISQTVTLFKRAFSNEWKEILKSIDVVEAVIVALLVGCLWYMNLSQYTETKLNDRLGLLMFTAAYFSFLPAFAALTSFPSERAVIAKERAAKSYKVSSYLIAKTLAEMPIHCITPTIWIFIMYPMTGFPWTAASFFGIWLTTLLDALVGHSFGMLTSALFNDFRHGSVFLSVILLGSLLTSGFYVKIDFMPVWIGWLKWFAFTLYTVNIYLQINLSGRYIECDASPKGRVPEGFSQCPLPGDEVISSILPRLDIGLSVFILIALFFAMKVICYCILRFTNKLRLQ